jgi:hypothetical protein
MDINEWINKFHLLNILLVTTYNYGSGHVTPPRSSCPPSVYIYLAFPLLHYHLSSSSSSSSSLAWGTFMDHSLPWISWPQDFYRVWLSTPRQTLNLEGQASIFVTPEDRVTQLYPQALGTHFSRPLRHAWATLGLFISSGHRTEIIFLTFLFYNYIYLVSIRSELSSGMTLKRRSTIILHGSTSQKTILNFIFAAVRTWNLYSFSVSSPSFLANLSSYFLSIGQYFAMSLTLL